MIFRGDVSHRVKKWRSQLLATICNISSFSYSLDHSSQMLMLHKRISNTN